MDSRVNNEAPVCAVRHVVVLGLNHASSVVEVRDRLLFSREKRGSALQQLRETPGVLESMILSTCNRVEVYAVAADPAHARPTLLRFLAQFHGIPVEEFETGTYFHHCYEAVEHLLSVIASLDSLVIGETQILGQVKDAYYAASQNGNTGQVLNKLLHVAMAAGKRVRTETKISEGIVSIASVAVELAKKILGRLDASAALIIGAGEMSELTARHLVQAGVRKLYFANRTKENAAEMAESFGGTALGLDEWPSILPECDIVISATGAPGYVISTDQVRRAMAQRKNRPVFLIDIAAPRDIEPEAAAVYNVFLYTIDDLAAAAADNAHLREKEAAGARAIIAEEAAKYYDWYRSLRVLPTVMALRKIFEEIRDDELKRHAAAIAGLPLPSQEVVRTFADSLIDKLLHVPWRILKEKSEDESGTVLVESLSELLGPRQRT